MGQVDLWRSCAIARRSWMFVPLLKEGPPWSRRKCAILSLCWLNMYPYSMLHYRSRRLDIVLLPGVYHNISGLCTDSSLHDRTLE